MGGGSSSCSSHPFHPDTSNVCTNDDIGEGDTTGYEIPGFCAPAGPGGEDSRKDYCSRIGDDEWEAEGSGEGSICEYNTCCSHCEMTKTCCKGCCPVVGAKAKCRRKAYRGNSFQCCFRDMAFNQNNKYCFDSNSENRTCPPDSRNITNIKCQGEMFNYCTGKDIPNDDEAWFKRWDKNESQNCFYPVGRNLFGNPNLADITQLEPINPALFTDAGGFRWTRALLLEVFNEYRRRGYNIGALPGFPGFNEFQEVLFSICSTVPGLCEQSLESLCSDETVESLLLKPEGVKWCGCFLPDEQYAEDVNEFQIEKQCTPICARQGNIPVPDAPGTGTITCNQDVCLINDVTFNLIDSQIEGEINFSQFCGGCSKTSGTQKATADNVGNDAIATNVPSVKTSSCRCIISGVNIDTANSNIGGDINLSQTCGATQCFRDNPDFGKNNLPAQIEVPCDAPADFDPLEQEMQKQEEAEQEQQRMNIIIAIIVLVVIVFVLLIFFLSGLGGNTKHHELNTKPKVQHIAGTHISSPLHNQIGSKAFSTPVKYSGVGNAGSILNR